MSQRSFKSCKLFWAARTLVDREFLAANLEKKLKEEQFSIVHVASHGEFGNDVDNTFLLTYDAKVSLDRLNQMIGVFRFRDDPLEAAHLERLRYRRRR